MNAPAQSYGMHPAFERVVLFYCTASQRFWSRLGKELEVELMALPEAKPILTACHAVTKETGAGPTSPLIVIQRLQSLVTDGKFTDEGVSNVYDLIEAVEDGDRPPMESVIGALVPVVKQRMHEQAIDASHHDFKKKGDMSTTRGLLDKAQRLGQSDELAGTTLDSKVSFATICAMQNVSRLSTGLVDLDTGIGGGLAKQCIGVAVGHSGAGKSMFLATGVGESVRNEKFTGMPTLELNEAGQLARVIANLTGIPTNDIIELEPARKEAQRRMEILDGKIGRCEIAEFAPMSTVRDLVEWIDQKEQDAGMKMEALFIDYADKMFHPGLRNANEYEVMRYVYEGIRRDIAVARDMWVWTASQATRPSKESQKRIELHHVSDSMHKIRVADLVVTINRDEDDEMVNLWVAKNRHGRDHFTVGPLMTHFECGRFVPVASEIFDWSAI